MHKGQSRPGQLPPINEKHVSIDIPDDNKHPKTTKPKTSDRHSYRHFDALFPTANKLLSKKWTEREYQLHLDKLRAAKSSIDNGQPKAYPHLELRLKKVQIEEGYYY
jgi:hypothetical protein